jgi:hypothetical protein
MDRHVYPSSHSLLSRTYVFVSGSLSPAPYR